MIIKYFASSKASKQAAIYFASDEIAYAAIKLLPDGYIGMLSMVRYMF